MSCTKSYWRRRRLKYIAVSDFRNYCQTAAVLFLSSITSLEHLNLTLMLRTVIETLEKSVRKF